jgi:hypothetical protein
MTAQVSITGMDDLRGRIRTWPNSVDDAVQRQILQEVQPMVVHMKQRSSMIGGAARLVGRTTNASSTSTGMQVRIGGSGLAGVLVSGAEYGGRKRPKRAYVNKSKRGRGYIVRRRTTQQFKPHLGNRGYWFWPTARKDLKGINKRVAAVLSQVVS